MVTKKGQLAELPMALVGFGVLMAVAIFVLASAIEAVPQNTLHNNETLDAIVGTTAVWGSNGGFNNGTYDFTLADGPFDFGYPITVFNGTANYSRSSTLTLGTHYILNDSAVFVYYNATGNGTSTLYITYRTRNFETTMQNIVDTTNANWNNAVTLLAIALIVLAAGAIIYATRAIGGGGE